MSSLESLSKSVAEVVKSVSPSVVQIKSSSGRGFTGSGVIWDETHIVTNSHVIGRRENKQGLEVTTSQKSYPAVVTGQDRFADVALLEVRGVRFGEEDGTKKIQQGDSSKLETGEIVLALANPFGESVSATFGIITKANASLGGRGRWQDNLIVSDVKLNPGYSGGPLVNALGKMVGMNSMFYANRGIAIPINSLAEVVKSISNGDAKRAYLGIVSDSLELPEEIAKEIHQEEGMIVLSVEADTPARKAGIYVGDIVVGLDSKPVRNFGDLRRILDSKAIGKEMSLSVLRGEKLTELRVTPSEASPFSA